MAAASRRCARRSARRCRGSTCAGTTARSSRAPPPTAAPFPPPPTRPRTCSRTACRPPRRCTRSSPRKSTRTPSPRPWRGCSRLAGSSPPRRAPPRCWLPAGGWLSARWRRLDGSPCSRSPRVCRRCCYSPPPSGSASCRACRWRGTCRSSRALCRLRRTRRWRQLSPPSPPPSRSVSVSPCPAACSSGCCRRAGCCERRRRRLHRSQPSSSSRFSSPAPSLCSPPHGCLSPSTSPRPAESSAASFTLMSGCSGCFCCTAWARCGRWRSSSTGPFAPRRG
mmetsp:Transcript_40869/g.134667  ORF Transcript_40869/g.134667 Transcript_40869/m.134667 type:complete len:280 (+) Transcript_40869:239-1078(+)